MQLTDLGQEIQIEFSGKYNKEMLPAKHRFLLQKIRLANELYFGYVKQTNRKMYSNLSKTF